MPFAGLSSHEGSGPGRSCESGRKHSQGGLVLHAAFTHLVLVIGRREVTSSV